LTTAMRTGVSCVVLGHRVRFRASAPPQARIDQRTHASGVFLRRDDIVVTFLRRCSMWSSAMVGSILSAQLDNRRPRFGNGNPLSTNGETRRDVNPASSGPYAGRNLGSLLLTNLNLHALVISA